MKTKLLLITLIIIWSGCKENISPSEEPDEYIYQKIQTVNELELLIDKFSKISDEEERTGNLDLLWDNLKADKDIPFVREDTVLFLYKGSASSVQWAGDFNGWNPSASGYSGELIATLNIWKLKRNYPEDARLDYKIVTNGSTWKLDNANSYVQYSGFGPNSELRMPDWSPDPYNTLETGATIGDLSDNIIFSSSNLGYNVQYKVYTPFDYASLSDLPVIYVTDGQEYSDERLGNMITVLNNLIYLNEIEPVIAVFVDPRNPDNLSQNRRADEYTQNPDFADFMADELKATIDTDYKTNTSASVTGILGTSLGGRNSTFVGFTRSDKFNLIGIHSPAYQDPTIYTIVENSSLLPLNIFMSTGTIFDTQSYALQMKSIFNDKGYPYQYIEVNEGHSWGNWRALLDEPLKYFYGTDIK